MEAETKTMRGNLEPTLCARHAGSAVDLGINSEGYVYLKEKPHILFSI